MNRFREKHSLPGLNATITSLKKVEDDTFICMGSAVSRKVKKGEKVSGNFAESHIERLLRERRRINDIETESG